MILKRLRAMHCAEEMMLEYEKVPQLATILVQYVLVFVFVVTIYFAGTCTLSS